MAPTPTIRKLRKPQPAPAVDNQSGPFSYFRPKDKRPITLNLTTEGRDLLDGLCRKLHASRADIVERLVRDFGQRVTFKARTS